MLHIAHKRTEAVPTLEHESRDTVQQIHEHLMVTCLDKCPNTIGYICKHWAKHIIATKLDSED